MGLGFTVAKMTESADFQPRQARSTEGQATDSTGGHTAVTPGMRTAIAPGVVKTGSMTSMAAVAKILGVMVMAVVPGGLLFLAAFVLARAVADAVRREEGSTGRRVAKAFAQVRLRDVWTSAKQTL